MNPILNLTPGDWFDFALHFTLLSPISVGGAIAMTPDMHRFLVDKQNWLTDSQFTTSIAIAQSAPGPNVLFVGLIGWNVGLNAGGLLLALMGTLLALLGMLVPSSLMTYFAARWGQRNRERRIVRAFKQGMAPIVVALLMASGFILAVGSHYDLAHWPVWLLAAVTGVIVWRTRTHLLWLLGGGALLGILGYV